MNGRLIYFSFCWILVTFLASSCEEEAAGGKNRKSSTILKEAPFAAISDSIKDSPNDAALLLRRAVLLSQNNLHEMATPDYQKAWELTKDEGVALEYTSNLFLSDQAQLAIDFLKDRREDFPHNTEFGRRLAEAYVQTGNRRLAMDEYDRLVQADPDNFETWFEKGMLQVRMGDTTAAIHSLERSFTLMPIGYSGLSLANLYAARKDERALEICDILIERDSSEVFTDAVFLKGIYYLETNNHKLALRQFEECIRRDWKLIDAHLHKGIVLFEMKETEKALEAFRLAATVSNTVPDSYYWMARCLEVQGKTNAAIENYERAIALDQDNSFPEAKARLKRITNAGRQS